MAPVEPAETISGLPFLVVTRYDRDLAREPIVRLHQEDLCQALGKPAEKYQQDGGPSAPDALALIGDESIVPARDRLQFWSALVFNVLIGNCDAHGKNYSLLYESRAPSLAPLYDLLSTTAYTGITTRLAMSIDGADRLEEVRIVAWRKLAAEIDFAPRFIDERMGPFVAQVVAAAEELSQQPQHSGPAGRGDRGGYPRAGQGDAARVSGLRPPSVVSSVGEEPVLTLRADQIRPGLPFER